MASFSKGTSFTDGVTGDVTAAKLHALVDAATPVAGLVTDRTAETSVASGDLVLISDASDSNALKKMTVTNLFKTDVSITSGTGTAGTVAIGPTGDTDTGLFFPAADTIAFSEGGAEAMRIDSSGNVLVGSSSQAPVVGLGRYISLYNLSHATISVQAVDGGNDRNATLELLSSGNGGSTSDIVFGDTDTTPGSPSPLRFLGRHNGSTTERLRIDSSGNVLIGKNSATANGGDLQISGGITFPASQSAKSDANTLDDYEEGTWTPSVGGNATYTANRHGRYTKIGRVVFIELIMQIDTIGTGSASVISNLPFAQSGNPNRSYITAGYFANMNVSMASLSLFATGSELSNSYVAAGGSTSVVDVGNIYKSDAYIIASGCYAVS